MTDDAFIVAFLTAAVRVATPLLLAALGELLTERGGVINLSTEGAMLGGALAAAVASGWAGPYAGVAAAGLAGGMTGAAFAAVAIGARANQIIAGTAVTLGVIGITGIVARSVYGPGGAGLAIPMLPALPVPMLSELPVIGRVLFDQTALGYLALALVPSAWWILYRTRWGLALRAAGESRHAAEAAGVPVDRIRTVATIAGGVLAGIGGCALVVAQVGTFAERMTAGRGFIAIAIVVIGRWHPWGVLGGALLFGATTALQYLFQAAGTAVPYQLFLALPYLVALAVLARTVGRASGPAELVR